MEKEKVFIGRVHDATIFTAKFQHCASKFLFNFCIRMNQKFCNQRFKYYKEAIHRGKFSCSLIALKYFFNYLFEQKYIFTTRSVMKIS